MRQKPAWLEHLNSLETTESLPHSPKSTLAGTHRVLTPAPGEDTISEALTAAFLRGDRHDFEFAYHSVLRESKPLRQLFDLSPDVGIRWSIPDLIRVTRSSAQPVFQVI